MICKSCGADNKDWASYCTQCGVPLGDVCRCSFVNEPGNLYCGGCGRPIIANGKKGANEANSSSSLDAMNEPLSEAQIKRLIRESLLLKIDESETVDQKDIDLMFAIEKGAKD